MKKLKHATFNNYCRLGSSEIEKRILMSFNSKAMKILSGVIFLCFTNGFGQVNEVESGVFHKKEWRYAVLFDSSYVINDTDPRRLVFNQRNCTNNDTLSGLELYMICKNNIEYKAPEEQWEYVFGSDDYSYLTQIANEDSTFKFGKAIGYLCHRKFQWNEESSEVSYVTNAIINSREKFFALQIKYEGDNCDPHEFILNVIRNSNFSSKRK